MSIKLYILAYENELNGNTEEEWEETATTTNAHHETNSETEWENEKNDTQTN